MRIKHFLSLLLLAVAWTTGNDVWAQSLALDATEYTAGATITVTVNGAEELGEKDWVGIYTAGTNPGTDSPSKEWSYVKGQSELTFTINEVGSYYVTLLANDGYEEIADRVEFAVVAAPSLWDEPALVDGVYQIGTASELEWYSEFVAAGGGNQNVGAVLTADIDMTGIKHKPIGPSAGTKFDATFDGQFHRILNMVINSTTAEDPEGASLFGCVRGGSVIKNIIIDKSCSITAEGRAGGLIAMVQTNTGTANPLLVINCVNEANVTSTGSVASGMIGAGASQYPYFEIYNCANLGNVKGASNNKGVCFNGWNKDTGTNCRIWHSYSIGEVSPLDGNSNMFRGNFRDCATSYDLVNTGEKMQGEHIAWVTDDPVASGELCWYLNNFNGKDDKGNDTNKFTHAQAVAFKQTIGVDPYPMPVPEGDLVYQNATYGCDGKVIEGSPVVYSNTNESVIPDHTRGEGFRCTECGAIFEDYLTPDGDGFYHLSTVTDVEWFSAMVNEKYHGCMNAVLDNDIDFEGVPNAHRPIGISAHKWAGIFDGQGHRIKGMVITRDFVQNNAYDGLGFFGSVRGGIEDAAWGQKTMGATIMNLIIDKSCSIEHGSQFAAGVVGHVNSRFDNTCVVSIINCGNEANITIDGKQAAGILGCVEGTQVGIVIRNCWNTGDISGSAESALICAWTGTSNAELTKEFSGCWNSGTLLRGLDGNGYNMFRTNDHAAIKNIVDLNAPEGGVQGLVTTTTEDPIASGELCYLLNGDQSDIVWYQTIGEDAMPTTDGTHATVYKAGETYSNTAMPELTINTKYSEDNSSCLITAEPTQEGTSFILSIDGGEEWTELPAEGYTVAWLEALADEFGICVYNVVVREVSYDEEYNMTVVNEGFEQVSLAKPFEGEAEPIINVSYDETDYSSAVVFVQGTKEGTELYYTLDANDEEPEYQLYEGPVTVAWMAARADESGICIYNFGVMETEYDEESETTVVVSRGFEQIHLSKPIEPAADELYTDLAYIECTGGERENAFTTDYIPNSNTTVKVGFQQTGTNGWVAIFCARDTWAGTGMSLYINGNNNANLGYFTGDARGEHDEFAPYQNGKRYDVEAHTTYLKWSVDGGEMQTKETGKTEMNATSRCLSFFANPEWDQAFKGRIYYFDIEDGEVSYHFVPVMRHDGVYGYLDKDSGKFIVPARGHYANYTFGVKEGNPVVTISTTSVQLKEGESTVVTVEGAQDVTWTSSDEVVATVENGVITGLTDGDCVITCTTEMNGLWEFKVAVSVRGDINYVAWNGYDDAILPSIRHNGGDAKWAYTQTFDSGRGYEGADFNRIVGTPADDANGNAWYTVEHSAEGWSYNNTVLPNGWPETMSDVYARRYFKAKGDLTDETVYMPVPHDDAPCEYYINGTLVWARTGYEPDVDGWYEAEVVRLTDEQKALIKTDGSINVFAYHVHQNWGGRYADGGLYIGGAPANDFNGDANRIRLEKAIAQLEAEGVAVPEEAKAAVNWRQDANHFLNMLRYPVRLQNNARPEFADMPSAEPADLMECWIYNVGAQMFLAGGNDWGTHTSLNPALSGWPMKLHANTSGENRYSIQTNLPNGTRGVNDWLGHNGYVDCAGINLAADGWAWEFQPVGDGTYRIINSQNQGDNIYFGMTEDRRLQVDTDKAGADNPFNLWKVFTKAQMEALCAHAAEGQLVDVSYKIHQNTFSQNDFDSDSKGAANAELNDSKWDRNAGSIWNWKNNNADGDYVFEMWNAKGDVFLKQTIEGLIPGRYIVSCQGFYRDGNYDSAIAGNRAQLAYLYAGSRENAVALPSILDGANKAYGYGNTAHADMLIPDGCAEAAHFFQMGCYKTQVEVEVGADGTLELGVFRGEENAKDQDWIVVDNFRLQYIAEVVAPQSLYVRNANKWDGTLMEKAADSDNFNAHFTWTGYLPNNSFDGYCFNFTLNEGQGGDACWGPASQDYVLTSGTEAEELANNGDKVYSYKGMSGYVTIHAYMGKDGNKVMVEDNTAAALKDADKLYIVGENTTGWSRSSDVCPAITKVSDGVYEGTVTIKRDNAQYDAIRLASVADNGDNDGFIGFADEKNIGTDTYAFETGKVSRFYMRKGEVKLTVDLNNGTMKAEYVSIEPMYFYAVGTLVDALWQNTNPIYKLEETELGSFVFKGIVNVAEDDNNDSRFSLFEQRNSNDWGTGRRGPADESVRPEEGVAIGGIATGQDRAWRIPAGEWLVTLDQNDGTFKYEAVPAEPEPELIYIAKGATLADEDWDAAGYDAAFPTVKDITVEAYEEGEESYVIIRAWAGAEGKDLKVAFDEEENVTAITPINDGVEGETATSGYVSLYTGHSEYYYAQICLDEGYCYASSVAESETGYVTLSAYFYTTDGESHWMYYNLEWPNSGDGIANVKADSEGESIYNLAGQRVAKAQKGIFIVGGKKVAVK